MPNESHQAETIAFLSKPATHGGVPVHYITTHISHIFLVGDRALKLKRARQLSFLDFTTLAARRKACEAELHYNRRTAPELYLGLIAVTRHADGLKLNGKGETIDYLVEMRRFADDALLSIQAARGPLEDHLVDRLADKLFDFHQDAERRPQFGGAQPTASIILNVGQTLTRLHGDLWKTAEVNAWRSALEAHVEVNRQALDDRRDQGFVRRCHGDLHLGNICLWRGAPVFFDCIEFSEEMASVDILYDMAFTAMDLQHYSLKKAANRFVNRYLERLGDYTGVALLAMFMSLRAGIRAMVHGLATKPPTGAHDSMRASGYFTLARELIEAKPSPRLIAIGGISGSGKSTLARAVAPKLPGAVGAIRLSSDTIRKRLHGVAPEQHLPSAAYDAEQSAKVYEGLYRDAGLLLRQGQTVIADATFLRAQDRSEIAAIAKNQEAAFFGIWLDVPAAIAAGRVTARQHDASDATAEVVALQTTEDMGVIAWPKLSATDDILTLAGKVRPLINTTT